MVVTAWCLAGDKIGSCQKCLLINLPHTMLADSRGVYRDEQEYCGNVVVWVYSD